MHNDTNKLKELAEQASAGDWSYAPCVADKHFLGQVWNAVGESLCIMDNMTDQANTDGEFIAAANPTAVLELIQRLERAEAEIQACASTLPYAYYMDPPDGGDVIIPEQLGRMAKDAKRYTFLKDQGHFRAMSIDMGGNHSWTGMGRSVGRGQTVDEAIDAEMNR